VLPEVIVPKSSETRQPPSVSEIRRERERAEMTERIMDVAREMFVRDGYEAVTLRKIADAIEYSQGAIYQYFKDKQALVQAIIRRDSDDLRAYLLECVSLDNPIEQLVEMARRYAIWGVKHPNHYRLMMVPPPAWVDQDRELHEHDHTRLEEQVLRALNVMVREAMDRGLFQDQYDDPALIAATLWAGINGVVLLEITVSGEKRAILGGKDTPFEARFETLKKVFLTGFLKP
jgi:AcrR family transcriptional regulator